MKGSDKINAKAKSRLSINLTLLGVCFTIFTLVVTLNPELFKSSIFLSVQLTLAIPLLITSIFARATLGYTRNTRIWNKYGFISFMLAYSFLINVIGLLLSNVVNSNTSMIFYGANIFLALSYSYMEIKEDNAKIKARIKKDLIFILILVLGGIAPSLGIY
jgi:hypothetical protein